ncbi:protein RALF-like 24 [Rhodamnia argentea]|uniref:Protein RALF-like 24 n=1 Tax=Rhodamnia argentea TaxID=178133 RepID=A0A8B8PH07_9MYRT|nr:protein RALF-like 24 [Rhodamnia argentea]
MPKLNPKLSSITFFHLSLLFILIQLTNCNGVSMLGLSSLRSSSLDLLLERPSCLEAAIGECVTEPEMEWEISRRVLAAQQSNKRYISYETLRRDAVPCQRSGASYYNCPGGQANQYNRGCAIITGCARNVRDIKT